MLWEHISSNDPFNTSGFLSILNCDSLSTIVIHSAFIFVVFYLPLIWANADFFVLLIVWMCHNWQFLFRFKYLNKLIHCVTFVFIVSWVESKVNYYLALLRRFCFHPCLFAGCRITPNLLDGLQQNLNGRVGRCRMGPRRTQWGSDQMQNLFLYNMSTFPTSFFNKYICDRWLSMIVDWFSFIEVDCWALVEVRALLSGILILHYVK